MYSIIENVRVLVGLLKGHGIKNVVVSPGGSSIPIVHSVENDDFFTCYSIIDERSAAYFALGIAQQSGEPVAVVCTSGTAACNYLPAVTEARYQSVPLVVITADKHPYYDKQLVTQVINQQNMYQDKVKHSVSLPVEIKTNDDFWYCHRLINEALLELNHHGAGPVHINIPTIGSQTDFSVKELPAVTAVERVSYDSSADKWQEKINELAGFRKILVVFGQHSPYSGRTVQHIEQFAEKYNCVLSIEHVSNIKCKGALLTYPIIETSAGHAATTVAPDLVISLGGNLVTYQMRSYLGGVKGGCKHWVIEESGYVKDPFKKLTDIFECTPAHFFEYFAENAPAESRNDQSFYNNWKELLDSVEIQDLPFCNLYASKGLAKHIPADSLLHLSILNSTRHMQFFDLDKSIRVYSNIGALGIDGTMSSFMGQAAVSDRLAFLMIGDLSFFYDMNSAGIKHVGRNVRILLVNNSGAAEFHFYIGEKNIPTLDEYISVRHKSTAKGWVESCGFKYLAASTREEFDAAVVGFVSEESDRPVLLEVFTDMKVDAAVTRELYSLNKLEDGIGSKKQMVKKLAATVLGDKGLEKAVKIAKIVRDKR
jgi:2-succinyl-5-enolpyruvyl-6-hydroxy-3-cyclohexene-1-carboxylate synthase